MTLLWITRKNFQVEDYMADIRGLVLHKILSKEEGYMDAWAKLKLGYFGTEYTAIYRAMSKFYINHSDIPSFEDLELHNRNPLIKISLEALKVTEDIEVDLDLTIEALINEYTQEETLKQLNDFVDEITYLESAEIKEQLGQVLLDIEEKTLSAEEIVMMNDISFTTDAELLNLMPMGFNNTFDAEVGGMAPTEVLAIGGERGSGKSNTCTNLTVNEYLAGYSSLYFTIEMRAREIFNRTMSLLSNVSLSNITKASLTGKELELIAKARADMFLEAEVLYLEYLEHRDYQKFEKVLLHTKLLKPTNQLVLIDNPQLTLANIDLTIQKFKAQWGDNLRVVVIDYLNQINIANKYNWDVQIEISAKLKEFARKYEIILCTPYQIDKTGEARFSKGILDSVDIAMILKRSPGRIDFESTKTRNMGGFKFASPFNDLTMRIDPNDSNLPPLESEKEEKPKNTDKEQPRDIPWN